MFQSKDLQIMHHEADGTTVPADVATSKTVEDLPRRIRDIATLRGLGYSFREIGQELNVTPQAVSLMLTRHRRSLVSLGQAVELLNLSSRAANALSRRGIRTRQEAMERNVLEQLLQERNCGSKTRAEIQRWMDAGSQSVESAA